MASKGNPRTRDVNAVQRVAKALELRAGKMTYEEIAKRCGYATRGACRQAIQRELERVVVTNVEELRREELLSLDELYAFVWPHAHDLTNKGHLFAVDRLVEISAARRKLMGLDVPPDQAASTVDVVIRETPHGYLTPPQQGDA